VCIAGLKKRFFDCYRAHKNGKDWQLLHILYNYIEEIHFQSFVNSLIVETIHVGFIYSLLRGAYVLQ
jgi:hypothetical protein